MAVECRAARRRRGSTPSPVKRGARLPVRAGAAVRDPAVNAVPSPRKARRRRAGGRRAPPQVGPLLRPLRRPRGADRMAELSTPETSSSCCARVERATCCEPADKVRAVRPAPPAAAAAAPPGRASRRTSARPSAPATPPRRLPWPRAPNLAAAEHRTRSLAAAGHHFNRQTRQRGLRSHPLRRRGRPSPQTRGGGVARLRRADRGRRPARWRDRARPRLRRRRRRVDLRPEGRADGRGDRARHDRRDARPRSHQRQRRPAPRTPNSSRATWRTSRCRTPPPTW